MSDILYEAAKKYQEMLSKEYYIVLGRQGKEYHLHIRFLEESFFHLIGLQHLQDIRYSSTNKQRIYKDILRQKITIEQIKKSSFYNKCFIEERITNLKYIEEMLESSKVLFKINHAQYMRYTNIKADYLCKFEVLETEEINCLYLFIVEDKFPRVEHEHKLCSFFKKHKIDYEQGTAVAKLLLSEKREIDSNGEVKKEIIFKHKNYSYSMPI